MTEQDQMANPLAGNFSSAPTFDTDEEPPSKKNGKQNGNGDAVELEGLKDQEKVQALERQLALTTRKVEDKEKFIAELTAAEQGERGVLEAFQAQIKRQEDELQTIRKVLWVQSKTKPAKKQRDQLSKAREELGAEKPIHKSPNTLRTLRDFERSVAEGSGVPVEEMVPLWAFVFSMPSDDGSFPEGEDGEESEGAPLEGEVDEHKQHGDDERVSHECWLMAEKIMQADCYFQVKVPPHGNQVTLAVGAPYSVLVDEAHTTKILMRLQETKGTMEFHRDLIRYYASNHGGINEYRAGLWTNRNTQMVADGRHFKLDDDLTEADQEEQEQMNAKIFPSGVAQRLVMTRLIRKGRCHPESMVDRKDNSEARLKLIQKLAVHQKNIPASYFHEVLECRGGYRPKGGQVFPKTDDRALVSDIAGLVQLDGNFVLRPQGILSTKPIPEAERVSYDEVLDFVRTMEEWTLGPGREETWVGTITQYFALHVDSELAYLKAEWGNPKKLFSCTTMGYDSEKAPKQLDPGDPEENRPPLFEMNHFSSSGNSLREHKFPFSLFYQPLEEIRNYFGDEIGLYYSWLGAYTTALLVCSSLGLVTMGTQYHYGGINKNPLTLAYSVYVGLWSVSFISAWNRSENVLRFVWGTGNLKSIEQPRIQFRGTIQVNLETGRQSIVHTSVGVYYGKQFASFLATLLFIMFTIFSAIMAQNVGMTKHAPGEEPRTFLGEKEYQVAGSVLNLVIIGVYGIVFEAMAEGLTEWENHRTQSEVDNILVAKSFLFQFVNNYFVLFYIAYLREVEDPISGQSHPCPGGNCLPELQMQLLVVFTTKTMGKQVMFTLKPFVFKWLKAFKSLRLSKKALKEFASAMNPLAAEGEDATMDAFQKPAKDPVQEQLHLMPFLGTFADFNDRIIQFGYLVLFAPCYPLAPFLAFLNNGPGHPGRARIFSEPRLCLGSQFTKDRPS
jgi:hypothetical protein